MMHDFDPDVVRDALRDFLQELKDNERGKDLAKIEVVEIKKQVGNKGFTCRVLGNVLRVDIVYIRPQQHCHLCDISKR